MTGQREGVNVTNAGPLRTVIVLLPGALASTVIGPADILTQAGQMWQLFCGEHPSPRFDVSVVAETTAPVTTMTGLPLLPTQAMSAVANADLVIIGAADVSQRQQWHAQLIPWLQAQYRNGATLASICTGAFVLAEAGLLDGRRATTHWGFAGLLRKRYPAVRLERHRMVTQDGRIFCSGGISAYAELCLSLVAHFCGPLVAEETARAMLIGHDRHNQISFAESRFRLTAEDELVSRVQQHIHAHFADDLNVTALAALVHVTDRTLKRRFKLATGYTLTEYQQRTRMDEAARLLSSTRQAVNQVADAVGYQDLSHFRTLFRRFHQQTPQQWRDSQRDAQQASVRAFAVN